MKSVVFYFWQLLKVCFFFIIFIFIFYVALNLFHEEYQGLKRYEEPKGKGVMEVFNYNNGSNFSFTKRLLEYYLIGE